jgi:hypothetical protein
MSDVTNSGQEIPPRLVPVCRCAKPSAPSALWEIGARAITSGLNRRSPLLIASPRRRITAFPSIYLFIYIPIYRIGLGATRRRWLRPVADEQGAPRSQGRSYGRLTSPIARRRSQCECDRTDQPFVPGAASSPARFGGPVAPGAVVAWASLTAPAKQALRLLAAGGQRTATAVDADVARAVSHIAVARRKAPNLGRAGGGCCGCANACPDHGTHWTAHDGTCCGTRCCAGRLLWRGAACDRKAQSAGKH